MAMLDTRTALKPYAYPWAVAATKRQQQAHWLPEEVRMDKDAKDWSSKLTPAERSLGSNIMTLFVQSDIDVGNGYVDHYLRRIRNPEIRMMLRTFGAQEDIHVLAYSHLMESLGFPDSHYSAFMEHDAMRDKHEHALSFSSDSHYDLALTMACYGGLMEGLQLFASFIMLLNFQRFGKLKGMGQVVAWSVRDETIHCESITQMHKVFVDEYLSPQERARLAVDIRRQCQIAVDGEDRFIDKAYEMGPVEGLSADDVKLFIRYIADRRLLALRQPALYGVSIDPQPWFDKSIGGVEHANFFETNSTAYTKGGGQGDWFSDQEAAWA